MEERIMEIENKNELEINITKERNNSQKEFVSPYLYVQLPNNQVKLGVSALVSLDEMQRSNPNIPYNNHPINPLFDFNFEEMVNDRYERELNHLYYERKKKLQVIIILDFICSLALLVFTVYESITENKIDATFIIYNLNGVLNLLNDLLGFISVSVNNMTGLHIFILFASVVVIVSTFVSFTPLIFFHLGVLLLTLQYRAIFARWRVLQGSSDHRL